MITKDNIFNNVYDYFYNIVKENKDNLTDIITTIDELYISHWDDYNIDKQYFNLDIKTDNKHYWTKTYFWIIVNECFNYDIFNYENDAIILLNKQQKNKIKELKQLYYGR